MIAEPQKTTDSLGFVPVIGGGAFLNTSLCFAEYPKATTFVRPAAVPQAKGAEQTTDVVPQSLLQNWQLWSETAMSDSLRSRLLVLAGTRDGWSDGAGESLSALSVCAFLRFWRDAKKAKAVDPFLTLTFAGHLQAEWHASWKRHLQIEFVSTEKAKVALLDGEAEWIARDGVYEVLSSICQRRSTPLKWRTT